MSLVLNDRVLETCTSPGTGNVVLLGAVTGFRTFSAGVGNANTCYYTIADQNGGNWEVGLGTYTASGNTLARTTVLSSSNSGSLVNFSSGTQNIFVTYPAEKAVYLDASGNLTLSGSITLSSGTANGVLYLNGSDVVTSGSGLVFDGANLGLGVTPSAWDSAFRAFEFPNGGAVAGYTPAAELEVGSNVYYSGGWKYKTTAAAALYQLSVGTHKWSIAPSGTAGSAISFTQAMTLDASGNLGIGITSPSSYSTRCASLASGDYAASFVAVSDASATNWARVDWWNQNVAYRGIIYQDQSGLFVIRNDGANAIAFNTNGANERARIDSSGNFLVGKTLTDANNFKIQVSQNTTTYGSGVQIVYAGAGAAAIWENSSGALVFGNDGSSGTTERMRLTSAGYLGIGVTSPQAPLHVYTSNAEITRFNSTNANGGYLSGYFDSTTPWYIGSAKAILGGNLADLFIGSGYGTTTNLLFGTSGTEKMRLDASGNLGIGTTANASAILDAQSTTKGVRFPNMTTTQKNAISSPAAGLVVFDTTLAKLCVYSGAAWQTITSI